MSEFIDGNSVDDYVTEVSFPRHEVSLGAVLAYFSELCCRLKVPEKPRDQVMLALEEALSNFFKHAIPLNSTIPVRLRFAFTEQTIRLTAHTAGRPFDFRKLPRYQQPASIDEPLQGLGNFLIEKLMDSVTWRYVEKEGQEFEMVKILPAPIALYRPAMDADAGGAPDTSSKSITYRRLETHEDALALAAAAWDLYGYHYKDVIYYPRQMLEKCQRGKIISWLAVNEKGRVVGHYAMMRHPVNDALGEMGAAFILPELRSSGVFRALSAHVHADAQASGLSALYSLSVTNRLSTQKLSEAMGRISVGLRLASSPAIFIEGASLGERITTVLNYHHLARRAARTVYLPARHRDFIRQSYARTNLEIVEGEAQSSDATHYEDQLEYQHDLTWNRARIDVTGATPVVQKLEVVVESLLKQNVACIMLGIDLEDAGAPLLCETAEKLGFFYSGIFPEGSPQKHDLLELQYLNKIVLKPESILLHQDFSRHILDYIKRQRPPCFIQQEAGEKQ